MIREVLVEEKLHARIFQHSPLHSINSAFSGPQYIVTFQFISYSYVEIAFNGWLNMAKVVDTGHSLTLTRNIIIWENDVLTF